jgi:ribokinase
MIFVVGNICRDTSFFVDRMPLAGETINALRTMTGLGGKGLNQAIAAHRSGSRVKLIAGVGEDWTANDTNTTDANSTEFIMSALRGPGTSDCSFIIITAMGENMIVTNAPQAERLSINEIEPHLRFQAGDALIMQGNLQPSVTHFVTEQARLADATVIFNPAPYNDWCRSIADSVDILILNAHEARAWTGQQQPREALGQLDVPLSIVTLGSEGCLARQRGGQIVAMSSPTAKVVDTTGAGDTFVGVFASEWIGIGSTERALRLALAAASSSVSKVGAASAIPSREKIAELRAQLS